ncbi:hypothetical protein B1987_16895 [Mycobacterium kansasii]|uniref:Uncharacterized protein n=1 Tax=Mycobacterium attenuatum TaxID=2341086 RepID=A0A498PR20_9MYCO|nr:hypothetical protein B1987_16895 [Mycobacterium kansasii]VBA33460.1 hypothetical protein LAUMK136_00455 [Mycobacterium attenuatum]VBA45695.1 hypothetical protein LAUMK191_00448 [Mycobacterium attenuatum]VBA47233.1 hypothetical protein LAUMK41_00518 [Mycobacterium attenuatum]
MAGWRDSVTEEAQADLDELVDAATGFALDQVANAGEFLPFALAVSNGGERQAIAPNYPRGSELPIAEQIATQWRALTDLKDSLRAAAVAVNVRLTEANQDGIEISIEHREGAAIGLIFPYARDSGGAYQLEAPSAHREHPRIWVS